MQFIKTKVYIAKIREALADFGYPVLALWLLAHIYWKPTKIWRNIHLIGSIYSLIVNKARIWISKFFVVFFFRFNYCSFCWYCWNCRPSMFKLTFHNNCNINVTLDRFKDTKIVNRRRRRTEIHFTWPKFHFLPCICFLFPTYILPVSFNTYSSNKLLSGWYTWSSRIYNIAYWSVWLTCLV